MKISLHIALPSPEPPDGLLVVDEHGFDYVPRRGSPRGRAFAMVLQRVADAGTDPTDVFSLITGVGGAAGRVGLGCAAWVTAPTRLEAIRQRAESEGWNMEWDAAASGPMPAAPTIKPVAHTPSPAPVPIMTRALSQAIAFPTLSRLFRHHGSSLNLRLLETHPGGGMYDCLGLVRGPFEKFFCNFNVEGSSLTLDPVGPPRPPGEPPDWWYDDIWRYPVAYFEAGTTEALADMIAARLGLPADRPAEPPSPSSVSIAVLAELAKRYAMATEAPEFRSGFFDSSGMSPSSPRAWVAQVPDVHARMLAAGEGTKEAALIANRLWGICDRGSYEPKIIVDLATGAVVSGGKAQESLWVRYGKGAGIRELAWSLERHWCG